jgi:hypothetical protein
MLDACTVFSVAFELAGPVEFSTLDLMWLLLAGSLALFGLPLILAGVAYIRYRKRAHIDPEAPPPLGRAAIVFVAAFVAQLGGTWVLSSFYEM